MKGKRDVALLTLREYALLFGKSAEWLRKKAQAGWSKAEKIDGRWHVYVAVRHLEAARKKPAA